jgi:hypothetical protein
VRAKDAAATKMGSFVLMHDVTKGALATQASRGCFLLSRRSFDSALNLLTCNASGSLRHGCRACMCATGYCWPPVACSTVTL